MKHSIKALLASAAIATCLAGVAEARTLTITTTLGRVSGRRPYVVVYITDPNGIVHDTVWVAGRKSRYLGHLRNWARSARNSKTRPSAVTGASAGSGAVIRARIDVADNLIAAGYQVRVDAAQENRGEYPNSAILTLNKQSAVRGRGVISSVEVQ